MSNKLESIPQLTALPKEDRIIVVGQEIKILAADRGLVRDKLREIVEKTAQVEGERLELLFRMPGFRTLQRLMEQAYGKEYDQRVLQAASRTNPLLDKIMREELFDLKDKMNRPDTPPATPLRDIVEDDQPDLEAEGYFRRKNKGKEWTSGIEASQPNGDR